MHFALVQILYRSRGGPEFTQISIHGSMRNCCTWSGLQARPGPCSFCTNPGFIFQALHHLSFLLLCTLRSGKHSIGLEVSPNFRKFSFKALCSIRAGGVVCRPILDCAPFAPFAPTQRLHFQALHPLSFLFICTLHWCKHCIEL